jgi:hypothetical protein
MVHIVPFVGKHGVSHLELPRLGRVFEQMQGEDHEPSCQHRKQQLRLCLPRTSDQPAQDANAEACARRSEGDKPGEPPAVTGPILVQVATVPFAQATLCAHATAAQLGAFQAQVFCAT